MDKHEPDGGPRRRMTSLAELRDGPVTLPVWHEAKPSAASVLGISRSTAYAMARTDDLPTLRLGHRVVVPAPRLLAMLGHTEQPGVGGQGDGTPDLDGLGQT